MTKKKLPLFALDMVPHDGQYRTEARGNDIRVCSY